MDPLENASIEYPCEWEYRVIGEDVDDLRRAVQAAVGTLEHRLAEANRKGRYLSMSLELVVRDEAERDRIFVALRDHPAVRHVL